MARASARAFVGASAAAAVRRGHPWVYREGLTRTPKRLASGHVVDLVDDRDRFLARGLWDAASPIAVRVFVTDDATSLDEDLVVSRVERAIERRHELFEDVDTTAFRLCNGEGDRVPGLVVDRYGDVAVARTDGEAMRIWLERLSARLARQLSARGVRTLLVRETTPDGARVVRSLAGGEAPDKILVRERGVSMEVDVARGHKTGAFLDQRENRVRVRAYANGRGSALDLFSYAGGFSVAAALGGIGCVTSVDTAAAAHASAQRTFRANGLNPASHRFVTGDVFAFLEQARVRGDRFDLVICDPPSFAPSERAKAGAVRAYRRLHAAVAPMVADGGILCAASCSSHVTLEEFLATLDDSALDGRLSLRETFGPGADHPSLPAWPEGRYLKFAVLY
jgi:23S rRNA (cytosine1962-C5)-methyltransferase